MTRDINKLGLLKIDMEIEKKVTRDIVILEIDMRHWGLPIEGPIFVHPGFQVPGFLFLAKVAKMDTLYYKLKLLAK